MAGIITAMPKKLDFTLTDEALAELEDAIKHDPLKEVRTRSKVIRQLHFGRKPRELAEIFCVTQPTIYGWWHRYDLLGITGLANEVKKMPRRKVTDKYLALMDETLQSDPYELGYSFAIWTSERLRDHLDKKTGIHISIPWLNHVMAEAGYVYRKPKHTLTNKQDVDAKEAARSAIEELKKRPLTGRSGFSLWTKRP